MPRFAVILSASGEAAVEVEAATEDEAISEALKQTPGMIVAGGQCEWNVESAQELIDG